MQKGAKKSLWVLSALMLLCISVAVFGQTGTIADRETADDYNALGYAKWIKVTVIGGVGTNERLNNNFSGMQVLVDLNIDGDNNYQTPPPGNSTGLGNDSYYASGDAGDILTARPGGEEGDNDLIFYVKIKQGTGNPWPDGIGYDTDLRPRIQLTNSGSLRIISGTFQFSIQNETDLFPVRDGILPIIRYTCYYDDGNGSEEPAANVHMGNKTPYDGYIDRIDLYWSEPMQTTNTAVKSNNTPIFTGLGSTIADVQSTGTWNTTNRRFTFFVISSQANTGLEALLKYNKPLVPNDCFKSISGTLKNGVIVYEAESQSRTMTDKAGPAIISAKTVRAIRRQPATEALASRRIEVTFSEKVPLSTVNTGTADFEVKTSATAPGTNNIQSIAYPTAPGSSSEVYLFRLTTNFASVNETGTIQFMSDSVVTDGKNNPNGRSSGPNPPPVPSPARGAVIPIRDGILPIIEMVETVDAVLNAQLSSGGTNGWGYIDYVDVTFDHNMNSLRSSAAGFSITGNGILASGGTGEWITPIKFRIPLTTTNPKIPNTGVVPAVTYTNPGGSNGLIDAVNGGYAENLLSTDKNTSSTNGLAVQVLDKAGPAIIQAYTAGRQRIRLTFSEKVNTATWKTTAAEAETPSRFRWFVGSSYYDVGNPKIFFTALSPARQDSVVYLNHTGSAWAKTDSGVINFIQQDIVFDMAATANGNDQWDNDSSINAPARSLTGSDVKVRRDNIPPILKYLETADFDLDGKIDHYRFGFDDLSPIYPKTSFKTANWTITGYDGIKQNVHLDMDVYNSAHSDYRSSTINAFGDTVELYLEFNETIGKGPVVTPYSGDTGDVPDVVVNDGKGFADWADNVMAALTTGLTFEKDKSGPAIMSAKTINTTEVDVFLSEQIKGTTLSKDLFYLNMGLAPGHDLFFLDVKQINPGQVRLTVAPQFYWAPDRTGLVGFANPSDVDPPVNAQDLVGNVNMQWWNTINGQIPVNDHAASQFIVKLAPDDGEVLKGVPFQIEVIAQDSKGNVDENFKERINFAALNISQNSIDLPEGSQTLSGGKAYFEVTCWVVTNNLRISVGVESDRYARYYGISDPITVVEPVIDTPDTLIVKDWPNDQGGYLSLVWPFSKNHPGFGKNPEIDYYWIYYDLNHKIFQYDLPIVAIDTTGTGMDSMRVNIEMPDNEEHTFWVRAVWSPTWPGTQAAPGSAGESGQVTISSDQFKLIRVNGKNVQNDASQMSTTKAEATLSGAAMGIGRAIDNIKPEKLAYLFADKEGEAVKLHWKKVIYGINGTKEKFPVRYQVYSHSNKAYFDLDTEGTLEATISDTAFTINTDEMIKFFCVRAIDSDNKSDLSARMGKWGFAIHRDSKPVYNYLSLPLNNATISNAKTFAEKINGLAALLKLDSSTNSFSKFYLPAIKFGENFSLSGGKPILVSAENTAPEQWFYTGAVPAPKSVQFTLNNSAAGRYNEIIVPFDKTNIKTADDLAKDIGGVDAVLKLNPATNSFSKFWLPAIKYGENFAIKPGEAVLINVGTNAPSTWPVYTSN
jgi:hypothetical protein